MRPDGCKLAINLKKDNDVIICRHNVTVKNFWRCRVSLAKFSYWSIFHVDVITGSGVTTIFVYKWLTRNSEIGNTHVWVLANIWRPSWRPSPPPHPLLIQIRVFLNPFEKFEIFQQSFPSQTIINTVYSSP